MAWQVYCNHCDLSFPVVGKDLAADQSETGTRVIDLLCPYCGREQSYTAQDVISAPQIRAN